MESNDEVLDYNKEIKVSILESIKDGIVQGTGVRWAD